MKKPILIFIIVLVSRCVFSQYKNQMCVDLIRKGIKTRICSDLDSNYFVKDTLVFNEKSKNQIIGFQSKDSLITVYFTVDNNLSYKEAKANIRSASFPFIEVKKDKKKILKCFQNDIKDPSKITFIYCYSIIKNRTLFMNVRLDEKTKVKWEKYFDNLIYSVYVPDKI